MMGIALYIILCNCSQFPLWPPLKHCKIYLCGTKVDLIESDRGLRQVDYHDVQDFADGKLLMIIITNSHLM